MISVIIPAYNAEKTIRQAISSVVCDQGDVEREIIIVNDGSTDKTPDILSRLSARVPNIHVLHQRNMGPGAARNAGLRQAKGNFVTFLDADDYLEPMALEYMLKAMLVYNVKACVAGTKCLVYGVPISSGIECWHELGKPVFDAWEDNFLVEITPGVRAKMFRREVLDGFVFPEGIKWEDLAFIPAALVRAGRVVALNKVVYSYRVHLNTTVKDFFVPCDVEDIITSAKALRKNLQKSLQGDFCDHKAFDSYRSILTLHTIFRMQNVMTWFGKTIAERSKVIFDLEDKLFAEYPEWRRDAVLGDSELGYKDRFFRNRLKKLYKEYLD